MILPPRVFKKYQAYSVISWISTGVVEGVRTGGCWRIPSDCPLTKQWNERAVVMSGKKMRESNLVVFIVPLLSKPYPSVNDFICASSTAPSQALTGSQGLNVQDALTTE